MLLRIIRRNGFWRTLLVFPLRAVVFTPLALLTDLGANAEQLAWWLDGVLPALHGPDT